MEQAPEDQRLARRRCLFGRRYRALCLYPCRRGGRLRPFRFSGDHGVAEAGRRRARPCSHGLAAGRVSRGAFTVRETAAPAFPHSARAPCGPRRCQQTFIRQPHFGPHNCPQWPHSRPMRAVIAAHLRFSPTGRERPMRSYRSQPHPRIPRRRHRRVPSVDRRLRRLHAGPDRLQRRHAPLWPPHARLAVVPGNRLAASRS